MPFLPLYLGVPTGHGAREDWVQNPAPIRTSCVSHGKRLFLSKSVLSPKNGGLLGPGSQLGLYIGHFPSWLSELRLQALLGITLNLTTSNK